MNPDCWKYGLGIYISKSSVGDVGHQPALRAPELGYSLGPTGQDHIFRVGKRNKWAKNETDIWNGPYKIWVQEMNYVIQFMLPLYREGTVGQSWERFGRAHKEIPWDGILKGIKS